MLCDVLFVMSKTVENPTDPHQETFTVLIRTFPCQTRRLFLLVEKLFVYRPDGLLRNLTLNGD